MGLFSSLMGIVPGIRRVDGGPKGGGVSGCS